MGVRLWDPRMSRSAVGPRAPTRTSQELVSGHSLIRKHGHRLRRLMIVRMSRSYRLRPWSRTVHLVLPGAGPQIATGARQALSVGLILIVISEMFAASNGVGFTIIQFERQFDIAEMWSGINVRVRLRLLSRWGRPPVMPCGRWFAGPCPRYRSRAAGGRASVAATTPGRQAVTSPLRWPARSPST